ncbi:MAG: gsiA 2 [Actinomycetia bacterium]|nr:gsiA 2 [Actinomycetes bacterium]
MTATATAPVVRTSGLTITFRRGGRSVAALRGVDLKVGRGEIVGLVGESGSGKSVLGLSLLGLLPRDGGARVTGGIEVAGLDMVSATEAQRRALRRRSLGAVFQDPVTSLNPTMRIGRQLIEAAGSQAEALRLLDSVGVPEPRRRLNALPHELSGGLRQRVMIAMAVAGRPSLIIADEPTTALDVTIQAQVLELLAHLRDELGCSVLLVTHDLGVAAEISDRICVMYAGRLVENGTAADILATPAHPYTRGLLRSRLTLGSDRDAPLATLDGEPPDPRAHPPGCAFAPRCPAAEPACAKAVPALVTALRHPGLAACRRLDAPHTAARRAPAPWPPLSAPSGAALEVRDLRVAFASRGAGLRAKHRLDALRGIDLRIERGESVALVGESGCGKTTLLRTVAGLQRATSGTVELPAGGAPQMVFQDAGASLTPWLSIGELLAERLRHEELSRADRRDRVITALRQVGLPAEVAAARPAQLSGGQRQRAALARAVVVPPALLLCDEPTSALDVSLAATVLNLLGRVRRELGMAMLFVTHDLAAARVVADRIVVMNAGLVVETGTAEQITRRPGAPYTRALVAAVPGTSEKG